MTNTKLFLLIGTSLSLIPNLIFAQCVATQDCETLGYTETSCSGGSGVKCPFGNKWACFKTDAEVCKKYGFTYTCTGTGEKGSGNDCDGQYSYCSCASGYERKYESCQPLNGAVDDMYYCNGVIVALKAPGMSFYVAMKNFGIMNWNSVNSSNNKYVFCGNVRGILPSKDQLLIMYQNKSALNYLLSTNGGEELLNSYYWSSTYGSRNYPYVVDMSNGGLATSYTDDYIQNPVRPILVSY